MARNIFNSIRLPRVGSNVFDLSHDVKMSFNMGCLVPTCCMDVVPGDKFTLGVENMLRFAPLISPVMHRVNVTTHYFFVPNRILWPEWPDWITGESEVTPPYVEGLDVLNEGTIGDYLGFVQTGDAATRVSAFPLAAYAKIYDEYYRDQNLVQEKFSELEAGNNADNYEGMLNLEPFKRAWMHDYFTSALPFAQKGDDVLIPLSLDDTPVELKAGHTAGMQTRRADNDVIQNSTNLGSNATGIVQDSNSSFLINIDPNDGLEAKTSETQINSDINTLRRAFKLQEWLERNARGGTRYIENILAHFGVKSSDARLQRPEYIGGTKGRMSISEVLSTADTSDNPNGVNVGYMGGHGISVSGGNTFRYRAEEHGWIIGIINVQPVTAYQQGLHRMFTREDRLDYFWPSFANIGEQEVFLKELWAEGTAAEAEETFGYVPRYAEYKYMNSRVAGEMKSSLDFWHLGRKFAAKPLLNSSFVESDPSTRIFAVQSGAHNIYAHIYNNIRAVRKMPKYGNPSF